DRLRGVDDDRVQHQRALAADARDLRDARRHLPDDRVDDVQPDPAARIAARTTGGTLVPLPALPSVSLPRDQRRHAASSVASIAIAIDAPCVLAWLAARTPGTR